MLVSVIIPHFNRSVLLKQTITSVQNQSFTDWEIIIADDCSADNEFASILALQNERVKVIQRVGGIKGPSLCRNLAVKQAKGKYLLFLDSDDLLAPFCLEQRVKEMECNPEQNMGIFLMEHFITVAGDTGTIFNLHAAPEGVAGLFLQNRNPWNVTCPIWRKDFFETVGGFDEELLFMEDPELHLRAISHPDAKIKTCYDKPADCFYRVNHIDNTKKTFWYNSIYYRIVFYKKLTEKNRGLIVTHVKDIKLGVYTLLRVFLYHRKNEFPELFKLLLLWMKASRIFSGFEIARIKFLTETGNSSSVLQSAMHIRGICYRLLPA